MDLCVDHADATPCFLVCETGKCVDGADATPEGGGARAAFCGGRHAALLPRMGPGTVRAAVFEFRRPRGQAEQVSDGKAARVDRSRVFCFVPLTLLH